MYCPKLFTCRGKMKVINGKFDDIVSLLKIKWKNTNLRQNFLKPSTTREIKVRE